MGAYELWFGKGYEKAPVTSPRQSLWNFMLISLAITKTWIVDTGKLFFCSHSSERSLLTVEPAIPVPCEFPQSWTPPVELRVYIFPIYQGISPANEDFLPLHLNWKTDPALTIPSAPPLLNEELEWAPLLDMVPCYGGMFINLKNVKFLSAPHSSVELRYNALNESFPFSAAATAALCLGCLASICQLWITWHQALCSLMF